MLSSTDGLTLLITTSLVIAQVSQKGPSLKSEGLKGRAALCYVWSRRMPVLVRCSLFVMPALLLGCLGIDFPRPLFDIFLSV